MSGRIRHGAAWKLTAQAITAFERTGLNPVELADKVDALNARIEAMRISIRTIDAAIDCAAQAASGLQALADREDLP